MKIICIARNYAEHAKELNNPLPERPVFFMKPDTALTRVGHDFYIPEFTEDLQYEVELVLKISKVGKYIQEKFASRYFDEISLGIDFTARDLQTELKEKGHPWEISKAFDNSAVVGKFFAKNNYDLNQLNFTLKKNEQTVQQGNSGQMVFSFQKIIAEASKYFTLKKGDLIFTGTPKGVGKVFQNDRFEGYIETEKVFEVTAK